MKRVRKPATQKPCSLQSVTVTHLVYKKSQLVTVHVAHYYTQYYIIKETVVLLRTFHKTSILPRMGTAAGGFMAMEWNETGVSQPTNQQLKSHRLDTDGITSVVTQFGGQNRLPITMGWKLLKKRTKVSNENMTASKMLKMLRNGTVSALICRKTF